MRRASPEMRALMVERFGSHDLAGPVRFLENAGYALTPELLWKPKPGVTTFGEMTREEFEALLFLMHEWDYGGFASEPPQESRSSTKSSSAAFQVLVTSEDGQAFREIARGKLVANDLTAAIEKLQQERERIDRKGMVKHGG